MGSLLGCRSATLAIAAGLSVPKSPWIRIQTPYRNNRSNYNNTNNNNDEENEKKQSMEEIRHDSIQKERNIVLENVGNSDHAMLASVYMAWDEMHDKRSKREFCELLGLNMMGLRDMKTLVRQLDASLSMAGFRCDGSSGGSSSYDSNVKSWRIVRSCVVAALAPSQIVRVERPSTKYHETAEGAVQKDGVAKEHRFFVRADGTAADTVSNNSSSSSIPLNNNNNNNNNSVRNTYASSYRHYHGITEERVFLHPSSSAFHQKSYSCPWLVYHSLVRTTKPFLRDATECNSYSLLLFGGNMEVQASKGLILMSNYVRFSAAARIGALMGGLRGRVDELLEAKILDPGLDLSGSEEMKIIVKLLMSDGMGK